MARPHLTHARPGTLTQGTIFSCATAFRYSKRSVYGLAITARCDVAQSKYRILNYVPVVALGDWLLVDGLEILNDIEKKDMAGKLKNELRQNDVSPTLLISISLEEIIQTHFAANNKSKSIAKARERLCRYLDEIKSLDIAQADASLSLKWHIQNRPKVVRSLISDLFQHKVLGYYFLERIELDAGVSGFVCLLREVTSLSREVAEALSQGISKSTWLSLSSSQYYSAMNFEIDDFAYPVSQLGSPFIEHLMQAFANLFIRIGITDHDEDEIESVCSALTSAWSSENEVCLP